MLTKPIEQIYQDILNGNIKRFPEGTWQPINGGYDNFRRSFRYIILEVLKWEKEEILGITASFFYKVQISRRLKVTF